MQPIEIKILIVLLVINLAAFLLFAIDKFFAKKGMRRIPELWLLLICTLFGALGGLLGMVLTHHKTNFRRHAKFVICVPLALVIQLVLLYYFFP